uniref:Integrase catalytic domain-containing protein n=1 Tax=Fagus sylvatica TaxID=28930 RepID=A0A2N9H9C9_FAGSY
MDSQRSVRDNSNVPSSSGSRTQASQSIRDGLHRQISSLKRQVRDKTPAKERPRRGREKDGRENSDASLKAHLQAEVPSPTKKAPGSFHSKHPSKSPRQPGGDALPPKALDQISSSPFSEEIERAKLPLRYTAPGFELYNGRTDPVAHIGHYHQRMALSRHNDTLMCRLFPSSLGEVALRWFNQIDRDTIASWNQMAEAFVERFITNSRRPKGMDVLMIMKLGHIESIKNYAARYSETYNDIEGCGEDVAVPTFKLGLPIDSGLRQSLTKRPPSTMRKLMSRIEQFIRLEEEKGNVSNAQTETPVPPPNIKPSAPPSKIPRVTVVLGNSVTPSFKAHSTVFKEPIYRILEKIKEQPFFVWPPKLQGDPMFRKNRPMCSYHRERGHLTEDCYKFKCLLERLVSEGHLSEYVNPILTKQTKVGQSNDLPGSSGTIPTGVIQVIQSPLCTSISPASYRSDIRKAFHLRQSFGISDSAHLVPKLCSEAHDSSVNGTISFSDSDLQDVQLPHNDPLVITLRIGNYDVKRVLVDQGSFAEVMYQELYEKLGLGKSDLTEFGSPVFGFSGESVIPLGKTTLLVLTGPINLQTEFIVIQAPSPYNAIMGRSWLHKMKAIPSILHQKLRFPTKDGVMEINGDQEFRDIFAWTVYEAYPRPRMSLSRHTSRRQACLTKASKVDFREIGDNIGGNQEIIGCGSNSASSIPNLAIKYSCSIEEEWEVESLCGLHRSEQGLSERSLSSPKNRSVGRLGRRACSDEFFRCISRISSNSHDPVRLGEDSFYYSPRGLLLPERQEGRPFSSLEGSLRDSPKETNYVSMLRSVCSEYIRERMTAALGRFISRSADKCRPFFRLLGKNKKFLWDGDCSAAFQGIKAYLSSPPCLSIPSPGEPLYLYLAVSDHAVSAVLVRETPKHQRPIFFISKTMNEAEAKYLPLEKAALALVRAAKKLPQYFQATTVTVLTNLPLKALLQWQVLADFVAEFQGQDSKFGPTNSFSNEWKLFMDGASNAMGSGARVVLISPERLIMEQAVRLNFLASNNESEYEALLIGLKSARRLGANRLLVEQIGREHNFHADILAKLATAMETDMQKTVTVEVLNSPSSQDCDSDILCTVNPVASWMDPLIAYLQNDQLLEDQKEADIVKRKAPGYWLSKEGSLYKRSFSGPYLLCVHPDLVNNLLYEIHEGICGSHTGGRSLAHRAMSQGYWWPYMQSDSVRYVKACDKCQRFAPKIHQPARELNPLSSPWPFAQWGIDIVGPLPRAPGNKKFLIVATDYFTKWVEAEPLSHIRDVDAKHFFWKNVVTRFGIPWAVISDNGTQFEGKVFKGFCSNLGIRNFFSSPGYPQVNGQAEVSNKVILDGIKKRLEEAKGRWVEELPSVLWTHRTTHRRSTGETPFALAYGVEAVIPLEVGLPTTRTTEFDTDQNENNLRKDLNLIEERRDIAAIRLASYQRQMKKGYDKNIRPRSFQINDLVLRKVVANTRNPNDGKLGPNWEGPYKVTSFAGVGAYRLEDMDGRPVPRPWNICNLKKYFF